MKDIKYHFRLQIQIIISKPEKHISKPESVPFLIFSYGFNFCNITVCNESCTPVLFRKKIIVFHYHYHIPRAYLLFPEDRRFLIRMPDELPLRWVQLGPGKEFRGSARRNEFYVFQIGVWAARTNLAELEVEFKGEIAGWLRCFNTQGTNWDGNAFHKTVGVPTGKVQALWLGVDVPRGAKPGEHRATVTIRPTNAPPRIVELVLQVRADELADRGDSEPWRLARLRWLDSTLGIDDKPTPAYSPLTVSAHSVSGSGFRVTFGESPSRLCQMPSELS